MGKTFSTGLLTNGIWQDASNNIGIGAAPSGSYKLEVTGTAKVSSTLLLGGALTGTSATLAVSVNNSNTGLDLTNNAGSGYGNSINFYQSTTKFGQIFVETSAANTSEMSFKTMVGSTLATRLFISATGAATFSSPVGANIAPVTNYGLSTKGLYGLWIQRNSVNDSGVEIYHDGSNTIINSTYQGTGTFGGMLLYTSGNPRIAITSGGNVGIGIASPFNKVTINTGTGNNLDIFDTGSAYGIGMQAVNGNNTAYKTWDFYATKFNFLNGNLFFFNYAAGTLSVNSSNQVVSSSDKNLKTDDGEIINALDKVLKLTPRYFYWKDDSGIEDTSRQLGFYAQEVNEALGEEVANTPKDENGKWGIYDRGIIAMLTKAIQELNQQNQDLKSRLDKAGL